MIYRENSFDKLVLDIKGGLVNGVLFHGTNLGLAKVLMDRLLVDAVYDETLVLNCEDLNPKDLDEALSKANANGLFGGRKIIKLFGVKDKHKMGILSSVDGTSGNLILLSGETKETRIMKKNFEESSSLGSIACYDDTDTVSLGLINVSLWKHGLCAKVTNQLKQMLSKDRLIASSELEKIDIFLENGGNENEVFDLLNQESNPSVPDLVDSFLLKDKTKAISALDACVLDSISPVMIVRMALNHVSILQKIQQDIRNGIAPDSAITNQFFHFSRKPSIMQQLKISETKLENIKKSLIKIEKNTKLYGEEIGISFLKRLIS